MPPPVYVQPKAKDLPPPVRRRATAQCRYAEKSGADFDQACLDFGPHKPHKRGNRRVPLESAGSAAVASSSTASPVLSAIAAHQQSLPADENAASAPVAPDHRSESGVSSSVSSLGALSRGAISLPALGASPAAPLVPDTAARPAPSNTPAATNTSAPTGAAALNAPPAPSNAPATHTPSAPPGALATTQAVSPRPGATSLASSDAAALAQGTDRPSVAASSVNVSAAIANAPPGLARPVATGPAAPAPTALDPPSAPVATHALPFVPPLNPTGSQEVRREEAPTTHSGTYGGETGVEIRARSEGGSSQGLGLSKELGMRLNIGPASDNQSGDSHTFGDSTNAPSQSSTSIRSPLIDPALLEPNTSVSRPRQQSPTPLRTLGSSFSFSDEIVPWSQPSGAPAHTFPSPSPSASQCSGGSPARDGVAHSRHGLSDSSVSRVQNAAVSNDNVGPEGDQTEGSDEDVEDEDGDEGHDAASPTKKRRQADLGGKRRKKQATTPQSSQATLAAPITQKWNPIYGFPDHVETCENRYSTSRPSADDLHFTFNPHYPNKEPGKARKRGREPGSTYDAMTGSQVAYKMVISSEFFEPRAIAHKAMDRIREETFVDKKFSKYLGKWSKDELLEEDLMKIIETSLSCLADCKRDRVMRASYAHARSNQAVVSEEHVKHLETRAERSEEQSKQYREEIQRLAKEEEQRKRREEQANEEIALLKRREEEQRQQSEENTRRLERQIRELQASREKEQGISGSHLLPMLILECLVLRPHPSPSSFALILRPHPSPSSFALILLILRPLPSPSSFTSVLRPWSMAPPRPSFSSVRTTIGVRLWSPVVTARVE
ncbi:hypothetical protein B9479_007072 [Cryptococcus floricola]|uniref:Uncharacterized protein n=1 Tax=Cryptococcus floricola TaxID=2591691 RepID=A0A5D3AN77_9TREE|nr:hypothetical protein B9479_007072 [Cryptococcus floricola]